MIFSAFQIQYGLLDMRKKSLFMRGDNYIYSYSFKIFNSIPFMYELKLMIDWTITPTSLDLFKWIKFESVYDLLFTTHCRMKYENKRKIGDKILLFNKISLGGCGFIIILLILLGPLLLFSNLNPTNQFNNVTSASIELSLFFIIDGVYSNFSLFSNYHAGSIRNITKDNIWEDLNLDSTQLTRNFPKDQVQVIRMSNVSDTNWILAQPLIEMIRNNLENYKETDAQIFISFSYSFLRPFPTNGQTAFNNLLYPIVSGSIQNQTIVNNFLDNLNCKNVPIKLDNFSIPTIHLSSDAKADLIRDPNIPYLSSELKLNCPSYLDNSTDIDYSRSYFSFTVTNEDITKGNKNGMVFVIFSDLVSETTASYDVIGFYISFILVIGKVIRSMISGEETRIILTEMPEPDSLITLCEGIKISRYRTDFVKEEYLYYVLIDLMRSPEIIKIITKSCIRKLKDKADRADVEKKNN